MRSLLFVPADSERKLAKAFDCGADVIILDLEDSVSADRKGAARAMAREVAQTPRRGTLAVRINPLTTPLADEDLAAVMPATPDLIMVPKTETGRDVTDLSTRLAVHEADSGIDDGKTAIIAIATETAGALFGLHTYRGSSNRLTALTWGAEDLSAVLGATRTRDETGALTHPYALARTLCLAGAVNADVLPIDTVFTDFRNDEGLDAECAAAAADGYLGKLAIHPAQVRAINAAFTPSQEAIAHAQAVVKAFANAPGAGVVALDGKMLDRPHLTTAEKVLTRAAQYDATD